MDKMQQEIAECKRNIIRRRHRYDEQYFTETDTYVIHENVKGAAGHGARYVVRSWVWIGKHNMN